MAARASTESTAPGVETLEAHLERVERAIADFLQALIDYRMGADYGTRV